MPHVGSESAVAVDVPEGFHGEYDHPGVQIERRDEVLPLGEVLAFKHFFPLYLFLVPFGYVGYGFYDVAISPTVPKAWQGQSTQSESA